MASDWAYIPGFDRGKEQYVTLDLADWVRKNGIKDEGARQGKGNQPPQGADSLDETEAKIVAWVNHRAENCRNDVTNHLGDLERELATAHIDPNLAPKAKAITLQARDAELEMDDVAVRHGDHLAQQKAKVRQGTRDFDEFRRNAGLGNRLPDYEQRKSAVWVIVGCFVVEVALNAGLLMQVNPFGLVGAALQMGLISAINIFVLGFAMGELLRQAHHVSLGRRLVAWLAMALVVALAMVFNLAVGHFRDSMEAVLTDPAADVFMIGADALDRFAADPPGLESFQSAMLALVGFLFFCVASWKWLHRDDVYPQYGRRHRRLEDVYDEYTGICDAARRELKGSYDRFKRALDDEYHQLTMICPKAFEVYARAKKIVHDYTIHLRQYGHHLDFLLATYRTANRNARTEPWPPHFDTKEHVDGEMLEPPSFEPPPESDPAPVFDSVHQAIDKLQRKYEEARKGIPTLEELRQAPANEESGLPSSAGPEKSGAVGP